MGIASRDGGIKTDTMKDHSRDEDRYPSTTGESQPLQTRTISPLKPDQPKRSNPPWRLTLTARGLARANKATQSEIDKYHWPVDERPI